MNADAPVDANTAVEENDQEAEVVNQVISKEDPTTEKDTRQSAASRPTVGLNTKVS